LFSIEMVKKMQKLLLGGLTTLLNTRPLNLKVSLQAPGPPQGVSRA
jgi:hypothetical protein